MRNVKLVSTVSKQAALSLHLNLRRGAVAMIAMEARVLEELYRELIQRVKWILKGSKSRTCLS